MFSFNFIESFIVIPYDTRILFWNEVDTVFPLDYYEESYENKQKSKYPAYIFLLARRR